MGIGFKGTHFSGSGVHRRSRRANLGRALLRPLLVTPTFEFRYLQTMSEPAPTRGGARRKADYIALTTAARARFDTLAAESIEAVFHGSAPPRLKF